MGKIIGIDLGTTNSIPSPRSITKERNSPYRPEATGNIKSRPLIMLS